MLSPTLRSTPEAKLPIAAWSSCGHSPRVISGSVGSGSIELGSNMRARDCGYRGHLGVVSGLRLELGTSSEATASEAPMRTMTSGNGTWAIVDRLFDRLCDRSALGRPIQLRFRSPRFVNRFVNHPRFNKLEHIS